MSVSYGTRSTSITTGAASAAFYNEAMMNRCQNPCDNSPVFTNIPVQILCNGQAYTFNPGAKDYDYDTNGGLSDSLTYEWAQPMSAANTNIAYTGSYAYNKAIYFWGFPSDTLPFPRGLHLDAHTGDIQFTTKRTEQTIMVIKVNEFRNGVKIAEIRRDLLFMTITCSLNNPPSITTANNVRSKSICVGQPVTFSFSTTDPDANDSVTISWNNAIPGASWSNTNGQSKHPTGTLTWTPTAADAGDLPYYFTVTATDNVCPLKASTTQSYQVIVNPIPAANITVSDSGCGNYYFKTLAITGKSPVYKWSSDSFTFSPDTGPLVSHNFVRGRYPYKLVMTAQGCSKTYTDTATIDTFMSVYLPADTAVCINSTISLQAYVKNVTVPYKLHWGAGNTTFQGDTTLTEQITITKDTTIWIRASYGSFNCPFDEMKIKVHPINNIILPEDTFYCFLNHLLVPKFPTKKAAFRSFKWYHDISPVVVDSNAALTVFDTGLFSCVATDTFGCVVSDTATIHLNPIVIASAADTSVCLGSFTGILADSISGHHYTYKWMLNNVVMSTTRLLKVSPPATSDYSLIATETLHGISCNDIHLTKVTIKPLPVIKFTAFTKACEYGNPVQLDNFVKVNGIKVSNGLWSCKTNPALVNSNSFLSQNASSNTSPGYKLAFDFTDTVSGCFKSDTVILPVYPKPAKPLITITGDTTACFGDSVSLTSTATFTRYKWSTGDSLKKITVKKSGDYKLVVTSVYGCISDSSYPVHFIVYPKTAKPIVSLSPTDSFLEGDLTDGSYAWYYRPDTLPSPKHINVTSRRINPKIYCNHCYFSAIHTDTNGCVSDTSAAYHFINLSIDNSTILSGLVFYPNPAHGQLLIENPGNEPAILIISDIFGRSLIQQKLLSGKSTMNISSLKPGIYILRLNNSYLYRLVVE